MNERLQNVLALGARVLIAALFLPAGLAKLGGFEGTVGYIASMGLPMPQWGAALAVASTPTTVPAPGLFSTMIGWPRDSDIFWANARPIWSVAVPAANGTMALIGLFG